MSRPAGTYALPPGVPLPSASPPALSAHDGPADPSPSHPPPSISQPPYAPYPGPPQAAPPVHHPQMHMHAPTHQMPVQPTTTCPYCSVLLSYPPGCSFIRCPQCQQTSQLQVVQRMQVQCQRCTTWLQYTPTAYALISCPLCQLVMRPITSGPPPFPPVIQPSSYPLANSLPPLSSPPVNPSLSSPPAAPSKPAPSVSSSSSTSKKQPVLQPSKTKYPGISSEDFLTGQPVRPSEGKESDEFTFPSAGSFTDPSMFTNGEPAGIELRPMGTARQNEANNNSNANNLSQFDVAFNNNSNSSSSNNSASTELLDAFEHLSVEEREKKEKGKKKKEKAAAALKDDRYLPLLSDA